ncbi:MAG: hypothetical protein ACQESC_03820 [Nanobdellota archaeon]
MNRDTKLEEFLAHIDLNLKHRTSFHSDGDQIKEPYAKLVLETLQCQQRKDIINNYMQLFENKQYLIQLFKDQIFVDLGAGADSTGYEIAKELGAIAYIGVEPYNTRELKESLDGKISMPSFVIEQDILFALDNMPGDSASFFMSGVDQSVIPPYREKNIRYIERITEILGDKVHPEGGFLSNCSLFNNTGLSIGRLPFQGDDIYEEQVFGETRRYKKVNMENLKKEFGKDYHFTLYSKEK